MQRRNKIMYWIVTVWLALGMLSAGIVQLMNMDVEVEMMTHLGYPTYLLTILGVSKLLGVAAILVPRLPLIKEWAYAGFFFTLAGAILSHLIVGDSFGDIFPPLLLLVLTAASWYFRPEDRKVG
jgi:uncharacterized membrane protein YphA (DoxX/SURF4 family)